MSTKIQHYVHLHTDNVELVISVTDKLKRQTDNLEKFGWITVSTGMADDKDIHWDNLFFFLSCDYSSFKKECKKDLKKLSFKVKPIFKDVKELLRQANKLNIL
jgi:hypothetical protein